MKCSIAVVLLLVFNSACSSMPPAIKTNEQANANKKHWEGTTTVLRNYRLPGNKTANRFNDSDSRKGDPKR